VLHLQVQGGKKCSTLASEAGCTGCALCAVRCPFDAIEMQRRPAGAPITGE
jgi:translation initiation factor RLI1